MSGVARLRLRRGVPLFDQVHAAFFGSGEQGIYMPGVHESFFRGDLFQDAAGTTPVTAAGQSVGLWLDRSGNDNHASQSTATSRPKLQQDANGMYVLRFDGVDDVLVTPAVDFTGTDKVTVLAGVRKTSDAADGIVVESYGSVLPTNRISLYAPRSGARYGLQTGGTALAEMVTAAVYPAPHTAVLAAYADIAADVASLRVNGVLSGSSSIDQGSGSGGNYALHIGKRGNGFVQFAGDIYGLIVAGAEKSIAQIGMAEALVNKYARAY